MEKINNLDDYVLKLIFVTSYLYLIIMIYYFHNLNKMAVNEIFFLGSNKYGQAGTG